MTPEMRSRCNNEARGWANDRFDILVGGQPMPVPVVQIPVEMRASDGDTDEIKAQKTAALDEYRAQFFASATREWVRLEELRR